MHCGKNFPLRKEKGDLDISVDEGMEDHEYLSIGVFKLKMNTMYKSVPRDNLWFRKALETIWRVMEHSKDCEF